MTVVAGCPYIFPWLLGIKSGEDIHEMYSFKPLLIRRYNLVKPQLVEDFIKHTPSYFLCVQRNPNLSVIRYLSMRDLKAFTICGHEERFFSNNLYTNALHVAAKHSESVELLKILKQIDQSMTKMTSSSISVYTNTSALGILWERSSAQFSTFNNSNVRF